MKLRVDMINSGPRDN